MGPYTFSLAFVSGVFTFAAVSSLALWRRSHRDWTLLLLGAVCAIGAVQSVAVLWLATTDAVEQARLAQRVRVLCGLMSFGSFAWLYAEFAHVRARGYLWFVTVSALAVAGVVVFNSALLGGTIVGINRATLPWGESISILDRTPSSALVSAVYVLITSVVLFALGCALRVMKRDRVTGLLLIVAAVGTVVPIVSGALVDIALAPLPYLGTGSLAAFILVIALQLAVGRRRDQQLLAAERTQRTLEQRLAQAKKMEALGQFAGGVAHDFNNILTIIGGHTDMLLTTASPETRIELEQIRLAATRAATMTGQLLTFSRHNVMALTIVDVNALVSSMETMLRRTVGDRIELVTRLQPDLWNARADANQLGRVLVNVAINARDAMPGGGRLTIETVNATVEEPHGPDDGAAASCRYVTLSLADTGVGMTAETKTRIFEPFFTTKEAGKGTGLGLAVVEGIVRQTGGHVEVDSEVGCGTTFRIFLPANND
jgi:signal transduction histidine kinase